MQMWRLTHALLTGLAVTFPTAQALAQERDTPRFIAVLEDAVIDQVGRPHRAAVHLGFVKAGAEWAAVTQPPARATWSVCQGGHRLATLRSRLPTQPPESLRFQSAHELTPGQRAPFQGKPSSRYAGWMGGEVYRPLVLTSTASCTDPERWSPAPPPATVVARLLPAMRAAARDVHDCDSSGGPRPYRPPDADISAVAGYISDAGARLISLAIRQPEGLAERCGVVSGPGWQPHTFAVLADGRVEHLGFGLQLLDAGDYDGDGRTEMLFQFGSYDRDGFVLASDSFRAVNRYEWSSH